MGLGPLDAIVKFEVPSSGIIENLGFWTYGRLGALDIRRSCDGPSLHCVVAPNPEIRDVYLPAEGETVYAILHAFTGTTDGTGDYSMWYRPHVP